MIIPWTYWGLHALFYQYTADTFWNDVCICTFVPDPMSIMLSDKQGIFKDKMNAITLYDCNYSKRCNLSQILRKRIEKKSWYHSQTLLHNEFTGALSKYTTLDHKHIIWVEGKNAYMVVTVLGSVIYSTRSHTWETKGWESLWS